jgi:hypothetical protein
MHHDPIVEEVHRVRERLLEEFGGDVHALMEEANRRLFDGEFSDYKIVTRPPRHGRSDRPKTT